MMRAGGLEKGSQYADQAILKPVWGKSERGRPRVQWLVGVFEVRGQYTGSYPLKSDDRKLLVAGKDVEA